LAIRLEKELATDYKRHAAMKSSIMPPGYSLDSETRKIRARIERDFAERLKAATSTEAAALKGKMEKEIKRQTRELARKHSPNLDASVMW
jgi:hypothetical protein